MGAILTYHNEKLHIDLTIERDTLAEAKLDFDDYIDDTGSRPEDWKLKNKEKYPRRSAAVKPKEKEVPVKK